MLARVNSVVDPAEAADEKMLESIYNEIAYQFGFDDPTTPADFKEKKD